MRFIILAAVAMAAAPLLLAPAHVLSFSVEDVIRYNQHNSWYAGKGITPGDFFVYDVCDVTGNGIGGGGAAVAGGVDAPATVTTATPTGDHGGGCYTIRLDFYAELQSGNRDVWVTQAEITRNGTVHHRIFMIDSGTMEIKTAYGGRPHADSVDATLFFLDGFAHKSAQKTLRVGEVWGTVGSFNDGAKLVVTSQDTVQMHGGGELDVFILQYEFFETSTFAVNRDMPFPVHGVAHDPYWPLPGPPVLFAFELVEYHSAYEKEGKRNGAPAKAPDR